MFNWFIVIIYAFVCCKIFEIDWKRNDYEWICKGVKGLHRESNCFDWESCDTSFFLSNSIVLGIHMVKKKDTQTHAPSTTHPKSSITSTEPVNKPTWLAKKCWFALITQCFMRVRTYNNHSSEWTYTHTHVCRDRETIKLSFCLSFHPSLLSFFDCCCLCLPCMHTSTQWI